MPHLLYDFLGQQVESMSDQQANTDAADYLVIGAGAMGMAFTDVLMTESDASVVIVDRYNQPGGHWNYAYPFVRLHQPSNFYGVNSVPLGSDTFDSSGLNQGLYELAGKSEISAYLEQVMKGFIESGRVRYLPMCEHLGEGEVRSLVSGARHTISANKTVDASYMNVNVPSMRTPEYEVAEGVTCVPPNALAGLAGHREHYVVVGAGKTALDSCLYLLENQVDPDRITWLKPRDSWLLDRARVQAADLFETSIRANTLAQLRASADSESIDDLFARVSAGGQLIRIDEAVQPTMYRCATVTLMEVDELRRIENVVRLGRVQRIEPDKIVLEQGSIAAKLDTLYIDCTADGLEKRPAKPVFDGDRITLQSVRTCQQVFSAAFIAHVELGQESETSKNEICNPVPHPDTHLDYLRNQLVDLVNGARWSQDSSLKSWLKASRLDGFSSAASSADSDAAFEVELESLGLEAAVKLQGYLAAGS
jgi:hypothetical protein